MDTGTSIVVAAAVLALTAAFVLRPRLPAPLVAVLLGLSGAGIAWGGMLIRPDPSIGEVVAAVVMLALLAPAHVRIVLGPFGRRS